MHTLQLHLIDLTGFPNVSLEFEHSFRFNNSINLEVSISTDSLSWTTYNVQGNLPVIKYASRIFKFNIFQ